MNTELYVENAKIDISSDIDAMMTFAIDDIKDFSARNTTFSKTIIIPGTKNNNIVFGQIFDIKRSNETNDDLVNIYTNYNVAKSAKCILFQGNLQIFKGVIRIMQIVIDNKNIEYECALFGELGGLISKIGNAKLTDLDLSRHNHTYSIANMIDTFDSTCLNTYTGNMDFVVSKLYIFQYDMYQVEAGDTIIISNASTNNGSYVVSSAIYDPTPTNPRTIITITTTFPLGANFLNATISLNKTGFGYHYPLIDYGTYSTDKVNWVYKTFRPAIFVNELFYLIFKYAGYTYKSATNFLSSALFRRLIIPYNQKVLLNRAYVNLIDATKTTPQSVTATGGGGATTQGANATWQTLTTLTTFSCPSPYDFFYYTGTIGGHAKVNIRLTGSYTRQDSLGRLSISLMSNSDDIFRQDFAPGAGTQYFDITIESELNVVVGTALHLLMFAQTTGQPGETTKSLTLTSAQITLAYDPPQFTEYVLGNTINMNDIIPSNILQKDFLSSVMKMFNLYLYEDKDVTSLIKIDPYIDFYDTNTANAKDWTSKVDQSKPMIIKPMSELNARYYKFKYKDDSDFYNEQYRKRYNLSYGSYIFDTEYEFAKDDQNIEVIFSGTPLVGYDTGQKVYSTIMKKSGTTEETIDSNIRILQIKQKTGVNNWYIKDTNGTTNLSTALNYYPYAGHFDDPLSPTIDINFGIPNELYYQLVGGSGVSNNLFNKYWLPYMYEIIDETSRLLIIQARLNEVDIMQLDFSKFVYIEGLIYRLNKIIDYNATERGLTKIELLKVIQPSYQPGEIYIKTKNKLR